MPSGRSNKGYRRHSNSPLVHYTHVLNSDIRRLKGCFAQLFNLCTELNLGVSNAQLVDIKDEIEHQLRFRYKKKKQELIDRGSYPIKGYFKSYTRKKKVDDTNTFE
jgi:hypothetical protein